MPRRKAAEVELLPPEDDQPSRGRKKLVEAEHTIKYSAPVPVTVEDDPAEDNTEEDFDLIEEEKAKRRKKTARSSLKPNTQSNIPRLCLSQSKTIPPKTTQKKTSILLKKRKPRGERKLREMNEKTCDGRWTNLESLPHPA